MSPGSTFSSLSLARTASVAQEWRLASEAQAMFVALYSLYLFFALFTFKDYRFDHLQYFLAVKENVLFETYFFKSSNKTRSKPVL